MDRFPPKPASLSELSSICIATKSRNLGDALALTALPRLIKNKNPKINITTYFKGFNPQVFANNPHVSGVSYFPNSFYGDDAQEGSGHWIELKNEFFGLETQKPIKPEIHLTSGEIEWARKFLAHHAFPQNPQYKDKPLCILHPWGKTNQNVQTIEFWDQLVWKWCDQYRFWQVGVDKQPCIQGCEYYFHVPPKRSYARKLFALVSFADLFLGVDSGPMHVARAFEKPSAILTTGVTARSQSELERLMQLRKTRPYFDPEVRFFGALYDDNLNLYANGPDTRSQLDRFLTRRHPTVSKS